MQCSILGYELAGMCFGSGSRRHMSVTFCVWNVVMSLSMAEPKSMMRDGDQGNRGIGNQEWSGVERNGVERSRTEQNRAERSGTEQNGAERSGIRIIRIKIKEKCDIIARPC